jgi:anaerobic magnesium-protoporphyrin IX monomethyl ester cyclase
MIKKARMRIGLVYLSADNGGIFPVGLMSLAALLKRRFPQHQVEIVDSSFEDPYERITASKYDLIGLSSMTIEYEGATRLAKRLKEAIATPLIIGGVHVSTLPNSLRACFDVGVVGEGEETCCDVVSLYEAGTKPSPSLLRTIPGLAFRDSGKVCVTPKRGLVGDLDSLPPLDYSLIDPRYFRFRALGAWGEYGREAILLTSRGCPYRCAFCSTSLFWDKVRYFSVPWVIGQIKTLVNDHGVDHIQVFDDLFTVHKKRLQAIAAEFRKEGLQRKVRLACQSRANLVDDELCEILKSMNVTIVSFGFESGNERMLRYLKCDSVTVEQNQKAIRTCVKHGLKVVGSVIMGSPTETLEEMGDTISFIEYTKAAGADRIWSFVTTPFPGTKMWEIARARGKVDEEMDFDTLSLSDRAIENPLLLDEAISPEAFKRVFLEGRRRLHYYKWKKLLALLRDNPVATLKLGMSSPGTHLKRMFLKSCD